MKKATGQFGVIAITLIIAFTMTACGKSGGDGGSGTPVSNANRAQMIQSSGEITFSLDKRSSTSFTITVEGANWNKNVSQLHLSLRWEPIIYTGHSRTSNSVITVTVSERTADNPGTATLQGNIIGFGALFTDGGNTSKYKVNPDKQSVSFP